LAGLDGAAVVFDGRAGSIGAVRLAGGQGSVVERFRPLLGFEEVVSQVGRYLLQAACVRLLEGGGDLAVELIAFAGEMGGVDRFSRERVAEGEDVGRRLNDELGADEL